MESPLRHLCPTLESRECKQLNPFAQSTLRKLRWPLNSHLCFGLHWPADQSEGFKRANTWLASRLQTRQFLFGLRTVHTLLAGLTLPPLHELNLSFFLFPIWILVTPPPFESPLWILWSLGVSVEIAPKPHLQVSFTPQPMSPPNPRHLLHNSTNTSSFHHSSSSFLSLSVLS